MKPKSLPHNKIGRKPDPQEGSSVLGVRLQDGDRERLDRLAERRRLRPGTLGRLAICEWMDRAEREAA